MAALRSGLVTIAILLGLGVAVAQQGENLAGPQQKQQQEKAQHSEPGRAGTTEPSSEAPTTKPTTKPDDNAVFIDGRLVVPGAPADSQTVPSAHSKRNAELDALPIMAYPLPLTDDQRRRISEAVSKGPLAATAVQMAELLPSDIDVRALPDEITANIPAVRNLSYVRTKDRVLLIAAANRIVVGDIPIQ